MWLFLIIVFLTWNLSRYFGCPALCSARTLAWTLCCFPKHQFLFSLVRRLFINNTRHNFPCIYYSRGNSSVASHHYWHISRDTKDDTTHRTKHTLPSTLLWKAASKCKTFNDQIHQGLEECLRSHRSYWAF